MQEEKNRPAQPRQATLAECLAFSRRTDQAQRADQAFIEAEQEKARLRAEEALRQIRSGAAAAAPAAGSAGSSASSAPAAAEGAARPGGQVPGSPAPAGGTSGGIDWSVYSDEQLVGMAASVDIDTKALGGDRELIVLALEEKGYKPAAK